ncbi:hypothetical protein RJT34_13290 [Clitoria ternatea]|uniref:Uncharacterized protein n=1 Tax=Clitoria ternatea TaxID=43366 RepID=A0AAN9PM60_CLITE
MLCKSNSYNLQIGSDFCCLIQAKLKLVNSAYIDDTSAASSKKRHAVVETPGNIDATKERHLVVEPPSSVDVAEARRAFVKTPGGVDATEERRTVVELLSDVDATKERINH